MRSKVRMEYHFVLDAAEYDALLALVEAGRVHLRRQGAWDADVEAVWQELAQYRWEPDADAEETGSEAAAAEADASPAEPPQAAETAAPPAGKRRLFFRAG